MLLSICTILHRTHSSGVRKSKEEIKQMAVDGAELLKRLTEEACANYRFEYSPESFTGTEPGILPSMFAMPSSM